MIRAPRLVRSTLIVIFFFGLSKFTGFLKLLVVTDVFGAGAAADAFTAASQLPELFQAMISGGALAAAMIPVYNRHLLEESNRDALRLANTLITGVFLLLGAICALTAWQAPWLTRTLLVPDFPPEQQLLTAQIMRLFMVSTTILGVSGVISGLLNARQHFFLPAFATVIIDLGAVAGLIFLVPTMGIMGAAWGAVFGAILHLLVQLPGLVHFRIPIRPMLDLKMQGVRQVIRLMGPQMIALSTVQAADLYLVRLASAYPAGSVAAYSYAFLFIQVPLGLFGFGIAVVLFPTLSHYYNTGNLQAFRQTHALSFQVVLALTVPAALGLVLLGKPGVALVFERGAFDAQATNLVYSLLVPFSGLIVAQATLEMVVRGFHARYNTRGPMWGYLGWLGAILLTGTLFHRWYGLPGLGLANTASYAVMLLGLYWLYRQSYAALPERILVRSLVGTVLATAGMALVVWLIVRLPYSNLTVVSASILIGGAVYLGLTVVLNRPMIRQFSLMFNRFPPQQVANT